MNKEIPTLFVDYTPDWYTQKRGLAFLLFGKPPSCDNCWYHHVKHACPTLAYKAGSLGGRHDVKCPGYEPMDQKPTRILET